MKLLHIINSLNTGGAEKLIRDTLPLYAEKGMEIDLLVLMNTDGPFLSELKNEDCCKIIALEYKNVYNPLMIFKIRKIIRNYDIIHVHLFPALYWVAIASILNYKQKFVFTEHNTSNRRRNNLILKIFDSIIYKHYDRIVAISDQVKNELLNHVKIYTSKIIKIENGINFKKIQSINSYKKNDIFHTKKKYLIQVSSFTKQKDQLTLIKALHYLPDEYVLLLVGKGETKNIINQETKELKLQHRVKFLGIRKDVIELMKTSDIIILSSHYEGLSIAALEAMSSGRPFIASDVPGLHELVKDAGILFPHGDAKQLAEEILSLMANPEYYREIGEKCQTRAKEYDINIMIDKHMELYKELSIN